MRLKITLHGLQSLASLAESMKWAEMLKCFDEPPLACDGSFCFQNPPFHLSKQKRGLLASFRYNFRHGQAQSVTTALTRDNAAGLPCRDALLAEARD
jgi:hypothetical protein